MHYLTMMFIYRALVAIGVLVSDDLPKLVLSYMYIPTYSIQDQDGKKWVRGRRQWLLRKVQK